MNKKNQLLDALFFIYLLTVSTDVITTKVSSIESSEVNNPNVVLSGKNETTQQRSQRIVYRLLSLFPLDLQKSLLSDVMYTNTVTNDELPLVDVLLTTSPLNDQDCARLEGLVEQNKTNQIQQKNNQTKSNNAPNQRTNPTRSSQQCRFVPTQLLTVLSRENACYSSIVNSLLNSLNYSFDLLLASLSLYQLYPDITYSTLSSLVPLQQYQAAPILSSLLRQRQIVHGAKSGKNNDSSILPLNTPTIPASIQTTLVGFWDAIIQGTGGVGISTEDVNAALKTIV